jgi:hypothetical protein
MTLEQYIRQNRDHFDAQMLGSHVWCDVEKALIRVEQGDATEQWLVTNRYLLDTAEPDASIWSAIEARLDDSDPLEDFIRQHRDAFDPAEPPAHIWNNLQGDIPAEDTLKSHGLWVTWRRQLTRVAAAVTLLIVGATAGILFTQSSQQQMAGMTLSQVSSEYAELEQHYERDITFKKEQLGQLVSNHNAPIQQEEIESDLDKLDKTMEELRVELANVPPGNREQVVRAMIETYKTKAAILERILDNLQQQYNNNNTSTKHEVEHM